ncbi:hypothetical protein PMALA_044400 [Plasmodium malariae]|uniref:Uncharacterized protein n=1 Tax=Plasmodium malariae TaxID=5858 RepID=A0A1A8WTL4_PLAMA|nr:hypothetical protein PMALA_044400 [Plasmodium malariae]
MLQNSKIRVLYINEDDHYSEDPLIDSNIDNSIPQEPYNKCPNDNNSEKPLRDSNVDNNILQEPYISWFKHKLVTSSEEPNNLSKFLMNKEKLHNSSKIDDFNDNDCKQKDVSIKDDNIVKDQFQKLKKYMYIAIKFFNLHIKPIVLFMINFINELDRMYDKSLI